MIIFHLLDLLIALKVSEVYIMPQEHREMWKLIKIRNSLSKTKTALLKYNPWNY